MTQTINQTNQKQNAVAVAEFKYEVDGEPVNLTYNNVQKFIVGSKAVITDQEFILFASLCKARKLNPFTKEAYLIKYKNEEPAQMVVGKDAILKRAVLHPQYDGKESGVIVKRGDGTLEERIGCFYDPSTETLLGGWCRVYRKDWTHPEYMSVSLSEVAQKKNGELNFNWASKTATMVEKVAKVRALREAFVEMFGGLYVEDELQQTNTQNTVTYEDPLDSNDKKVVDVEVVKPNTANEEFLDLSDL